MRLLAPFDLAGRGFYREGLGGTRLEALPGPQKYVK